MLSYGLADAIRTRRLAAWCAQVRTGRDIAGRPGDRRPMLGAVIDGIGFMLAGAIARTGTTAATTADIEWNGADMP